MKWANVLLLLNLAAVLFLAFTIHTSEPVKIEKELVNVTNEQPIHNVSCPRPVVEPPNVTVKSYPGNIQNPELETRTSYTGDVFKIHGIDSYGELYGSSMSPSIMDGDTIISTEYTGQDLSEGVIIRYEKSGGGEPRIHRVVGDYQAEGYVVASGDRLEHREKVELDEITHIVKAVVYG